MKLQYVSTLALVPLFLFASQAAVAQPYPFQTERSNSAACLSKFQDTLSLAGSYLVLPSTSGMARLDILQGGVKSNGPSAPLGSGKFSTVMYPVISTYGTPSGSLRGSLSLSGIWSASAAFIEADGDDSNHMTVSAQLKLCSSAKDDNFGISISKLSSTYNCSAYFTASMSDSSCSDTSKKLADMMIPATALPNIIYHDYSVGHDVELAGSASMTKSQIIAGIGLGAASGVISSNAGEGFLTRCQRTDQSGGPVSPQLTQGQGESNSDFAERSRVAFNDWAADAYLYSKQQHIATQTWLSSIASLIKDKTIGDMCNAVR